jgi:very-short-patch-repair endonuclease
VVTTRKKDDRVPRARRLRRDMTIAEKRIWRRLRELAPAGAHLRRQATIGPYIVDFACHTKRIVVEIDGGQHGEPTRHDQDRVRDDFLNASGYRVLRFWNNDVMQNLDGVIGVIADAFESAAPPTPDPSPPLAPLAGGGERSPDAAPSSSASRIAAIPTPDPSPPLCGGRDRNVARAAQRKAPPHA